MTEDNSLMLFDLSRLPEPQRTWARATLQDFAGRGFDFTQKCSSQVWREARVRTLPIRIADLSSMGWAAATWPDRTGIKIDDDMARDEDAFRNVLGHELGHIAEFFYLTTKRIAACLKVYQGVYPGVKWHDVSHPWVAGFQVAFSRHQATDDRYPPVDPIPAGIRRALA